MEFPDGVIGIMGPNGAGKSTLIEAVSWALYGNKSEIIRSGKEGIRRSGAGTHEECSVQLIFDVGGVQYQVKRAMRGKDLKIDAELLANGGVAASTDKAVTAEIERILGMDHRAFFISVFARQKDLSALSVLNPADRKKLIMRMLELDVLQKVQEDIRSDWRDERKSLDFVTQQLQAPDGRSKKAIIAEEIALLEAEAAQLRSDLAAGNEVVAAREKGLEAAKGQKDWAALKEEEYRRHDRRRMEKSTALDEARRAAATVEGDLRALRTKLAELPALEAKDKEYEEAEALRGQMEENRGPFQERMSIAASLAGNANETRQVMNDSAKAAEELTKLKNSQESLDAVTANLEKLTRENAERSSRSALLDSEVKRLHKEIGELARKRDEVAEMGPESHCPACERKLGEQHHYLLSKLEKEAKEKSTQAEPMVHECIKLREEMEVDSRRRKALEERKKKLAEEVKRAERLSASIEGFDSRLAALAADKISFEQQLATLGTVEFDEGQYSDLKKRIASLKPFSTRYKVLRGEGSRLPDLEIRSQECVKNIGLREKELADAQAELAEIGYAEGDLKRAQQAYEDARSARETAYNEVSRKASSLELAEGRVADKRKALEEVDALEKSIAERTRKVEELGILEKVMIDFKQNVMDRVVPTLSEISSQLFTDMTDSKYGGIELDEDYEMEIYDGGVKYPLSRFSGGEGDLANLCLRLAISRLLADRSGNDINFLILDEIFGSQDQVRKRNIMSSLNQLEKQFHQIILITHIDDTKDLMSSVITVKELEDGTDRKSVV